MNDGNFLWMKDVQGSSPAIMVYRGIVDIPEDTVLTFDYSADERCQLYWDGKRIAEGPERGTPELWYYGTVTVTATAGRHVICARVIQIDGNTWFYGQLTICHGFAIRGLQADWSWQQEKVAYEAPFPDWGAFPRLKILPGYNPDILAGKGGKWLPVKMFEDNRRMEAGTLPPMRYDAITPKSLGNGLFQFESYVLAYAVYHLSGKGIVRIRWNENPYDTDEFDYLLLKGSKGKRNGRFFMSNWDEFAVDGTLTWATPYWHAGRYVEIQCIGDVQCQPEYFRTGYPLPEFHSGDPLMTACYESLQNCCFETFLDCPFYEQLMYTGDSRIESLLIYKLGGNPALIRKALKTLALSQQPDGSLRSHYPSKGFQIIISFMPIWFLMLRDYVQHYPEDPLREELRPVAKRLLDYLNSCCVDGLLTVKEGTWNFLDWCDGWDNGVPAGQGPFCVLSELFVLGLRAFAEVYGDNEVSRQADDLCKLIVERFLEPETGLFRDTLAAGGAYSEHAQILALLCGIGNVEKLAKGLAEVPMVQCSSYFSYYYLLACRQYKLNDLFDKRMAIYRGLLDEGLKTMPEEFRNPRSDCHAWSAHPLLFSL